MDVEEEGAAEDKGEDEAEESTVRGGQVIPPPSSLRDADKIGLYKGELVWTPVRPWFCQHVLAEARGDPPPGEDEVGVRDLARRALRSLQRAEAEALIWEGLAHNRLLDLAEFSALDTRVIGRLVDIQEGRQRSQTLPHPGAEIEEGALPTKPHPDVEAKIVSKL